jgi:hypothetical protein
MIGRSAVRPVAICVFAICLTIACHAQETARQAL